MGHVDIKHNKEPQDGKHSKLSPQVIPRARRRVGRTRTPPRTEVIQDRLEIIRMPPFDAQRGGEQQIQGDQNRGEIRLITVLQPNAPGHLPSADTEGRLPDLGEVHYEVDHFPLEDYSSRGNAAGDKDHPLSRRFVALSYMWGSEDDLDEVYINDYVVPVRRNLKKALEELRSLDAVQAGCKVWCDALCIDQSSAAECNREIKRMRDIYQKALHVVVWLGETADGSDDALDFINGVSRARSKGIVAVREYLRDVFATQGVTIWNKLSDLITRQYFSRLWIIQEIALGGGRDAFILCGKKVTTWEKLYRVYHSFHIFKAGHKDNDLTTAVRIELESADPAVYEAYRNVFFWKWEKCEDFQILQDAQVDNISTHKRHLMTRCRNADCAKPVDKVYGILGLVGQELSAKITPDYNSSVRETYMAFTRAWIETEGTLEALVQCGTSGEHYRRDKTIPSWVIDLRQIIKPQINNFEPTYNAHGRTRASATFVRDGMVLSAKGILFDKIDGLSGTRYWDDDCLNLGDIQNSTHNSNPYGTDDAAFTEALWRAFVGNRDRFGNTADPSHSCLLDSAILEPHYGPTIPLFPPPDIGDTDESVRWNLHLWMKRNADFVVGGGKPLRHYFQDIKALERDSETYHRAIGRLTNFLWARRLVTTEKGYVGVIPRPAQRGDIVAVLLGCSTPLLLRPDNHGHGHTYELVAECYVHGIMDGEVVKGVEQGTYTVQDVLIS